MKGVPTKDLDKTDAGKLPTSFTEDISHWNFDNVKHIPKEELDKMVAENSPTTNNVLLNISKIRENANPQNKNTHNLKIK